MTVFVVTLTEVLSAGHARFISLLLLSGGLCILLVQFWKEISSSQAPVDRAERFSKGKMGCSIQEVVSSAGGNNRFCLPHTAGILNPDFGQMQEILSRYRDLKCQAYPGNIWVFQRPLNSAFTESAGFT